MYPQPQSLATHGRAMYFRNGETVGFGNLDCLAAVYKVALARTCAVVDFDEYTHAALDCRYEAAALWSSKLVAFEGASRLLTLASR